MAGGLDQRARRTVWRAKHRHRPLKAAIHGACQADALRKMLENHPACAGQIEFFPLQENWRMTDAELDEFERVIAPQLDVFIFQPDRGIARADRFSSMGMVQHLRPDCLWVSFPMFAFGVYAPFVDYGPPELGPSPFEYLDFSIVAQFLAGVPEPDVPAALAALELDDAAIADVVDWAMKKVEAREVGEMGTVDVLVSHFLRDRMRSEKLFHTINHPALPVMSHLAEGVLERLHALGALDRRYDGDPFEDHLDQIRLPIHPSIQRSFGLPSDAEFIFNGRVVSDEEAVSQTYAYLRGVDRELLAESLEQQIAKRSWFDLLKP